MQLLFTSLHYLKGKCVNNTKFTDLSFRLYLKSRDYCIFTKFLKLLHNMPNIVSMAKVYTCGLIELDYTLSK